MFSALLNIGQHSGQKFPDYIMNHYQVRRNLNSSTIITALNYDERASRLNQGSQQLKTMPHNKTNIDSTFSYGTEARDVQHLFKEAEPQPEVTAVLWDC